MTSLRFATAPVNWNNDDIPGWRAATGFPELLDLMVSAGYRATEYDDKIGPEPEIVGAAANERGLVLCGFYQWFDLLDPSRTSEQIEAVRPRLEQLASLGCRDLIVSDQIRDHRDALAGSVPDDGSQSLDASGYHLIAEQAFELAKVARTSDFHVHYHNHVGTWIEAPHEVSSLASALDGSGVDFCFDTGHFAYGGGDSLAFVRSHLHAIGHVHIKDVDGDVLRRCRERKLSFREALRNLVFAPLGEGTAQIADILRELRAQSFPGWVVIEQDTCAGDPTDTARANLHFARSNVA